MNYNLKNLADISFIGDLSLQDADLLAKFGKESKNILEFGAGGSTQIFAQCNPTTVVSVETEPTWVSNTQSRLLQIKSPTPVSFIDYSDFEQLNTNYDLIFVDGIDKLRLSFANKAWELLADSGVMLFHDTRRPEDIKSVFNILNTYYLEISAVIVNIAASDNNPSNISAIYKRPKLSYINWNKVEGKKAHQYGAFSNIALKEPLWQQNTQD